MFDLVGSKFGAGALPGTRSASSRKLRPFSGSTSIRADRDDRIDDRTAGVDRDHADATLDVHVDAHAASVSSTTRDAVCPTSSATPSRLTSRKPGARDVDVHHPRCQIRGNESAVRAGHDSSAFARYLPP